MDLSKLDDDQIKVALKVIESAKKHGINPDWVLPMVNAESGFRPDASSGKAYGPMQLTPDTAKTFGVDQYDVDQNIDGGMRFLKSLVQNKKLASDPNAVIAAYNAGPNAKFFETGDLADLPDETVKHVVKVMGTFGSDVPNMTIEPQEAKPEPETQPSTPDDQYSGKPVATEQTTGEQNRAAKEMGAMGAAIGTGAGSVYTAKAPIFRMAQRVGILPGGKPISPADAANLVEKTMSANAPESVVRKPHGGENWQKSLTGISTPGAQMDKASLDLAKDMQGAVSIKGAPGFTGGTITPGGIILSPQDATVMQAKQAVAAAKAAEGEANLQKILRQAYEPDVVQRGARAVVGSAPVKGGLAGLGVGYNLQDAAQKFREGDVLGGSLAGGASASSALGLVPKIAPVMNPLAVGLTTASQVAGDLRRGDKESAAQSGLTGLAALFPRLFGPLGALTYSRGLNTGEEDELAKRRQMRPTITP